jgi:hypothetical protein
MATSSSSTAPLEAPEQSPKAKRRIHVSLTSIRTQGDRNDEMFRIYNLKVNKKNDSKTQPISTRYIYDSDEEAQNDVNLFRWYHGDRTNEPGEPAMPEPWDPDWIYKPRKTDSWIAIIAFLEGEGVQLPQNSKCLKKVSGLELTCIRLPSAFFVPAYNDLSDATPAVTPTMSAVMIGWKS